MLFSLISFVMIHTCSKTLSCRLMSILRDSAPDGCVRAILSSFRLHPSAAKYEEFVFYLPLGSVPFGCLPQPFFEYLSSLESDAAFKNAGYEDIELCYYVSPEYCCVSFYHNSAS